MTPIEKIKLLMEYISEMTPQQLDKLIEIAKNMKEGDE